jgi:YggT family protein
VSIIATVLYVVVFSYFLLMWARLILDVLTNLSRDFRPRGFVLIVAEISFTLTDPPIRLVRKVIPPLRLGGVSLDFAWSIVMFAVIILLSIVSLGFAN